MQGSEGSTDLPLKDGKVIGDRKDRSRKRVPEYRGRVKETVTEPANPRVANLNTILMG